MLRRKYIYHQPDWPLFRWDCDAVSPALADAKYRQGMLAGRMSSIGFDLSRRAILSAATDEAVSSGGIEGETLDPERTRSSVARRLGMDAGGFIGANRDVDGIVDMTLDATQRYDAPLTAERLFAWQSALFPTGRSGLVRVEVGKWRTDARGPMRVVSGPVGRERVHYEAPPAASLDGEMARFLDWFESPPDMDGVLKAAVAHLWFVTIHPFDDGNGRIARAIADMALARAERSSRRFYGMSSQILAERAAYYRTLERTQRGTTEITEWTLWFLRCLARAVESAETALSATLERALFWQSVADIPLNARQRMMLDRLLDGFLGKLTASKWARLSKCSHDTALRDINALIARGILRRGAKGGRSASYELIRREDAL